MVWKLKKTLKGGQAAEAHPCYSNYNSYNKLQL